MRRSLDASMKQNMPFSISYSERTCPKIRSLTSAGAMELDGIDRRLLVAQVRVVLLPRGDGVVTSSTHRKSVTEICQRLAIVLMSQHLRKFTQQQLESAADSAKGPVGLNFRVK